MTPPWGEGPVPDPIPYDEWRQAERDSGWLWHVIDRSTGYYECSDVVYRDGYAYFLATTFERGDSLHGTNLVLLRSKVQHPELTDWVADPNVSTPDEVSAYWESVQLTSFSKQTASNTWPKLALVGNRLIVACATRFHETYIACEPEPGADPSTWHSFSMPFTAAWNRIELLNRNERVLLVHQGRYGDQPAENKALQFACAKQAVPTGPEDFTVYNYNLPGLGKHHMLADIAVINGRLALMMDGNTWEDSSYYASTAADPPADPADWRLCALPGSGQILEVDDRPAIYFFLSIYQREHPAYSHFNMGHSMLFATTNSPESVTDWEIYPAPDTLYRQINSIDGKPAIATYGRRECDREYHPHDTYVRQELDYWQAKRTKPQSLADWERITVAPNVKKFAPVRLMDVDGNAVILSLIEPFGYHSTWLQQDPVGFGWRKHGLMLFTFCREPGPDGPDWRCPEFPPYEQPEAEPHIPRTR